MPKADNNECYKTRFAPYSGSYLKKYNELSRKKVSFRKKKKNDFSFNIYF